MFRRLLTKRLELALGAEVLERVSLCHRATCTNPCSAQRSSSA